MIEIGKEVKLKKVGKVRITAISDFHIKFVCLKTFTPRWMHKPLFISLVKK